jgi:hypothetical protein
MALIKFRIHYIKGKENARVEALNRRLNYIKDNKLEEYRIFKIVGTTLVYTKP